MANVSDVANAYLWLDRQDDEEGISNLKLQKLVYYAQGFFLAIFDRPLFEDKIEAWTHGPVVPALYHKYKNYGRCAIPLDEGFDYGALSKDEAELVEEVHRVFGQFSAWKLREMTHSEPPWRNHEASAGVIPQEELRDYFKTRIN